MLDYLNVNIETTDKSHFGSNPNRIIFIIAYINI